MTSTSSQLNEPSIPLAFIAHLLLLRIPMHFARQQEDLRRGVDQSVRQMPSECFLEGLRCDVVVVPLFCALPWGHRKMDMHTAGQSIPDPAPVFVTTRSVVVVAEVYAFDDVEYAPLIPVPTLAPSPRCPETDQE